MSERFTVDKKDRFIREAREYASANCVSIPLSAIEELDSKGVTVLDGLFESQRSMLKELGGDVSRLCDSGALAAAQQGASVRGDKLGLFHEHNAEDMHAHGLLEGILVMKSIGHSLEQAWAEKTGEKPSLRVPSRVMAAVYDGSGSKYIAHRDVRSVGFDDPNWWMMLEPEICERYVTAILYLPNQDWEIPKGGELRCFLGAHEDDIEGKTANETMDIEPVPGRLVLFMSRDVLHEVRPAHSRRMATSIWFLKK